MTVGLNQNLTVASYRGGRHLKMYYDTIIHEIFLTNFQSFNDFIVYCKS